MIEKEGLNPNQFYTISGLGNGYLNNVGESFRKPTIEKNTKKTSRIGIWTGFFMKRRTYNRPS
ncbi:hypothetical protein NXW84_01085 [Bacteroides fragilis]|nr:hypothetical protein NXW84_01085 [Bacteroides fragilis]